MHFAALDPACPLMLAPMAGFTDAPMRALCRRLGATLTVTEMVSAAAICYDDVKTAALADLASEDSCTSVQLFGHDPAQMEEAAARVATGRYRGCASELRPAAIDLNMGCPVRKITAAGDGSALMRTPEKCGELVAAAARGAKLPITVKIRAGWDSDSVNAAEVALACVEAGAAAVCVHGRTRAQMYAPSADWSVIRAVRQALPAHIPVIGNGDVTRAEDYFAMRAQTGCDGVAIGRAALGNPWLFADIASRIRGEAFDYPTESERRRVALELARQIIERSPNPHSAIRECRGRIGHFLHGSRGDAARRALVHQAESFEQLAEVLGEEC